MAGDEVCDPLTLQQVIDLFHEAEREIKKIERLDGDLSIPSINELRYAGYHLACAWQASQQGEHGKAGEETKKATRHCQRAIYDANEIGVQHHLNSIALFQEDYRKFPLTDVIKDYAALRVDVRAANAFIQNIAKEHQGEREQYYAECAPHYERIKTIADTFDEYRSSINAKIMAEKRAVQRWLIGLGIGFITAMLVAAIKLIH